ncbi:hypothetical protein [Azospirillum palustre]
MNSFARQTRTSPVDVANPDSLMSIAPTPIDHGGFDAHA